MRGRVISLGGVNSQIIVFIFGRILNEFQEVDMPEGLKRFLL